MRVAQLVETLGTGGAEKLAVQIASGRSEAGDFSALITLAGSGPLADELSPEVTVIDLGMDLGSLASQVRALFRLSVLCRRLRLDALQTHLPRSNFFGLFLALTGGIAVFPTVHNNREFDYGAGPSRLRLGLRKWAYRRLVSRCRRMIAVADSVKAAMIDQLGLDETRSRRIVVIPNGVEIPQPLAPEERARVRARFGVAPASVLIVGAGRLTEQKNFPELVRALAGLGGESPRWDCLIAGEGPGEDELAAAVRAAGLEDRIGLPGRIPDVDALLGAADIFCMPSLWEGLPLALLESMAAGLPTVASDIDGIREVVRDGRTGTLVRPGDPSGLTAALDGLLRDPARRTEMGRAARIEAERHYSLARVTESLGALYAGRED